MIKFFERLHQLHRFPGGRRAAAETLNGVMAFLESRDEAAADNAEQRLERIRSGEVSIVSADSTVLAEIIEAAGIISERRAYERLAQVIANGGVLPKVDTNTTHSHASQ